MRTSKQTPINPTEQYIEDVLVSLSANKENLIFQHPIDPTNKWTCTLRYSYYRKLDEEAKELLKGFIEEYDMDDDDCGTLYFYHVIPNKK